MTFPVYLSPTTASPPDAQIEMAVKAAIAGEGGTLDADGVTLRMRDGARVHVGPDLEHFGVEALSPSFCRMLFNAALKANATIDRGGSDLVSLKMQGAKGRSRYLPLRSDTIASPADLCARLQRDLDDWKRFISEGRSEGTIGPDEQLLQPPPDPGTEARVTADPSGVAEHCETAAREFQTRGWKVLRSVVTRNAEYGVVWRADVTISRFPHDPSRLMCWQAQDSDGTKHFELWDRPLQMFDPTQSVPPLAPEPAPATR